MAGGDAAAASAVMGAGAATAGAPEPEEERVRTPAEVLCAACSNPFVGEDGVEALGRQWHVECFCCEHCKVPFRGSEFFEKKGKAYCKQVCGRGGARVVRCANGWRRCAGLPDAVRQERVRGLHAKLPPRRAGHGGRGAHVAPRPLHVSAARGEGEGQWRC